MRAPPNEKRGPCTGRASEDKGVWNASEAKRIGRINQAPAAPRIIARLLRQVEKKDTETARLRIALLGCEAEPVSPFPLLSGDEVINILHPTGENPAIRRTNRDDRGVVAKGRAIARRTHRLIRAGKSGMEIRAAILIAAEEFDIASNSALTIAANILRAESANG